MVWQAVAVKPKRLGVAKVHDAQINRPVRKAGKLEVTPYGKALNNDVSRDDAKAISLPAVQHVNHLHDKLHPRPCFVTTAATTTATTTATASAIACTTTAATTTVATSRPLILHSGCC